MTREEALSHVAPNLSYFNNCKPEFAIKEYKKWVNEIYDDFEEQTCSNCKYYTKNRCLNPKFEETIDAEIYVHDDSGLYIEYFLVDSDFGCNKWESKND